MSASGIDRPKRCRKLAAASLLFLAGSADQALAHGAERGFVLLLPVGYVVLGGALAIAVSFAIVALVPDGVFERGFACKLRLGTVPGISPVPLSLISAVFLCGLIVAGFIGTRDPLANPLPLTIWTVWWVGVVLLHAVLGNAWAWLNPFAGPYAILDRLSGGRLAAHRLPFSPAYDYLPALLVFLPFAWFQLVAPAPHDPARLAAAVSIYSLLTLFAVCLFGPEMWLAKADPFAVFLRLVAALSPIQFRCLRHSPRESGIYLRIPGAGLADLPALPVSGALFVLLTLSSVSFDGLSNTFWWLSLAGINPLDFPGRTALIGLNTLGLIGAFIVLTLLFTAAVIAGWRLAGEPGERSHLFGRLVLSLIPISIGFHFAHYLTDLMVNGQYAALVLNDPLGRGWNLIGLREFHVTTSFLNSASGSLTIFSMQTAAIVTAHIASVAVAHLLLLGSRTRRTIALEASLAILMVAYTAFGLWLLLAPSIG
ncbi:MAG: hypothetical protein ACT4SY_10315 [Hyphomicrobiales bacterium]